MYTSVVGDQLNVRLLPPIVISHHGPQQCVCLFDERGDVGVDVLSEGRGVVSLREPFDELLNNSNNNNNNSEEVQCQSAQQGKRRRMSHWPCFRFRLDDDNQPWIGSNQNTFANCTRHANAGLGLGVGALQDV